MIEILKKRTIENSGLKMNKLGDCIALSNHILEKHDEFISYNTLRRFFGVINNKSGAGGFRTLLVTYLFPGSYKIKNPEVKHRSNILSH